MPPQTFDLCSVSPLARRCAAKKKLAFDANHETDDYEFGEIFFKTLSKREQVVVDVQQDRKRRRSSDVTTTDIQTDDVITTKIHCPMIDVIRAVERLSTNSDLVADGSRDNTLPTVTGKHKDLKCISPGTTSAVLDGVYDHHIDHLTVIDCRYPYEFAGGHIRGAINLFTKDAIRSFLNETVTSPVKNHVVIFLCEFSSERGPKMYRHLRSLDRELNKNNYPRLNFPEIYLLEGGYKALYLQYQSHCFPQNYIPMLQQEHADDLRKFRIKSKSWAAGDKPNHRSCVGLGHKLAF